MKAFRFDNISVQGQSYGTMYITAAHYNDAWTRLALTLFDIRQATITELKADYPVYVGVPV